ncbi:Rieske (2Fe-2S) protein [Sinobaca sp. H24]|uniref:Rieske (2Fe-2S) protein n=1 Tax=Sinobaca sp. H24 TaxID=2923376 RepID=UPI00207AA946|nr:Rieske (2Fe-2S) protein [Sinobaca sp. H24]
MEEKVCTIQDLNSKGMIERTFSGKSIIICRSGEGIYAFLNRCPHQGAPLSKGKIGGSPVETQNLGEYCFKREGEILRCPWHGREFDITNGGNTLTPDRSKLKEFTIKLEGEDVIVSTEKKKIKTAQH